MRVDEPCDPSASWECRPGAARRPLPAGYRRRQPEATLLHALVAEQLEDLLLGLAAASPYGHGLPRHVEKELRAFLECGRLEKGFARPRCGGEMALIAVILDPAVAAKIIGHLGLAPRAPPPRR